MKKRIQNIAVIIVSVIFLLTANGIFFIKHFCSKEKTPEIVFLQAEKKDCCKEDKACNIQETKTTSGSCSCEKVSKPKHFPAKKDIKEKCCTYSYFFVKILSPYFNTTFKQFQTNSVFANTNVFSQNFNYNFSNEIAAISRPPPGIRLPLHLLTNILRL